LVSFAVHLGQQDHLRHGRIKLALGAPIAASMFPCQKAVHVTMMAFRDENMWIRPATMRLPAASLWRKHEIP
jgi:hypothetical protein